MKRVFWILFTPLAIAFIVYAFGSMFVAPHVKKFALEKLEQYTDANLPFKIRAQDAELRFFRPGLSLNKVDVIAKDDLAEGLPQIQIERVSVFVDFFKLLGGRLNLSAILVASPTVVVNLDPFIDEKKPHQELPMEALFNALESLPLQRVFVQNLNLKLSSKKMGLNLESEKASLLLTNMEKSLTAKVAVANLHVQLENWGDLRGSFDTHLYLTPQSLRIIQLGVHLGKSRFLANGEISQFARVLLKPSGVLNLGAKLELSDLYEEIKRNRPETRLPTFAGVLETDAEVRFDSLRNLRGQAQIKTQALRIDKFDLGDARIQGEFKDKSFRLSEIKISHPAGEASLSSSEFTLDEALSFKSNAQVQNLDLQALFRSLNLPNIPVGVQIKGSLPCSGHVKPQFLVQCQGVSLTGRDLWVKAENTSKGREIVSVEELAAQGQVSVSTKAVNYKAELVVKDSKGTTEGVIDFSKGFHIKFKTPDLNMKNIRNLAGLKMIGSAGIDGFTEGDSYSAIFDMNINAREFDFEGFKLGNLITLLKYRKGHLIFEDIAGAIGKSQYLGYLDVNLNDSKLEGDFVAPSLELPDVTTILHTLFELPIEVSGKGTAKAHIDGPLDFWKMNYRLESSFKNPSLGPENFDSLLFNVSAKNGNIQADKISLRKGESVLQVSGKITSEKELKLLLDGTNWKLENSDLITLISSNIAGNLNFSSELRGPISDAQLVVKGSVTDTYLEEQELANSNFLVKIDRQIVGGEMRLFGDKVQGQFQIPFGESLQPFLLKLRTNNWSYSTLLALVGGTNLANEYESSLSAEIDLKSESGRIFKSSGKITVPSFFLKRGALNLRNPQPIEISLQNGIASIKNFELEGPQSTVTVRGDNFSADRLDVAVQAELDLRLLQIFFPFLDELGGPLKLTANISGPLSKPQILGSTSINSGYLKIKGFPHPIERLNADVAFSQSRVLINSIRGNIAGGTLRGEGGITIAGINDIPTSIRLSLNNVTLNVPDKVRTSGNADLLFSGNWFPFTLSGTYQVNSALVEKEFTEDGDIAGGIRQSRYLPKLLRRSAFEPVLLDIQILLGKNIRVKNSLIDGAVAGNLQVKGPPTTPVLLGRITTEKGSQLIFKDKIFDIQNGVIDFKDPDEINPDLYISATSRINEYDVTVLAQGPSKNLDIQLSSIPPLNEQDIVSLIALGVTSTTMEQNIESRNQATQTGVEIGGAVLAAPINRGLEKTLGVNFSVSSEYDSTRNISVPKVTLSRQISEKIKWSASRPVGDTQSYDTKLEYQLNSNWTAIGSYESRGPEENAALGNSQQETLSIFGLDLEFKREFK